MVKGFGLVQQALFREYDKLKSEQAQRIGSIPFWKHYSQKQRYFKGFSPLKTANAPNWDAPLTSQLLNSGISFVK